MADNSSTEETAYLPTRTEEALLCILLSPSNRLKTVEELCKLVPCDPKTYYNAFRKPGFVKLYREESIALTVKAIAPVVNSVVREASRGSHQHSKILLGMADIYHEKSKTEVTGKDGGPVETKHTLTDDLLERIAAGNG
jgi:hypothetical protein